MLAPEEVNKYMRILCHMDEFNDIDQILTVGAFGVMLESLRPVLDEYEHLIDGNEGMKKEKPKNLLEGFTGLFTADGKKLDKEDDSNKK